MVAVQDMEGYDYDERWGNRLRGYNDGTGKRLDTMLGFDISRIKHQIVHQ